jgi:hypothetical protein
MSEVKNFTKMDEIQLSWIKCVYGEDYIPIELSGKIRLHKSEFVTPFRVTRLVSLGKLKLNKDGILDGFSQTCSLTK